MRSSCLVALVLLFLAPGPAAAEFQFQPSAVTVGVGPAMLHDGIGTTVFLAARMDLGRFTEHLLWEAGLHWWQKTEVSQLSFFGETSRIEARYRDLALTSGVKYLFPVDSRQWIPYARGGLGLNFVDVAVETTSGSTILTRTSAGDTDFGVYLGAGTAYRQSSSLLLGMEGVFNVTDAGHFLLGFTASFPIGSGGRPAD